MEWEAHAPTWTTLYRALAHPKNRYRYGALLPEEEAPSPSRRRGLLVLPVPEGRLVLANRPLPGLEDLGQRPVRSGPFLLTWGRGPRDPAQRARFLVSPSWVRERWRSLEGRLQGYRWPREEKRLRNRLLKAARDLVRTANQATREIQRASRYALLPPPTAQRWDKAVRRTLRRTLTGLGLTREEIEQVMTKLKTVR